MLGGVVKDRQVGGIRGSRPCHDSKFCIFSFWNNFRFTESCKDSTEWSLLLASPGGYILQNYSMMCQMRPQLTQGLRTNPILACTVLTGRQPCSNPHGLQSRQILAGCCACTACSPFVYNVLSCFVFLETMRRPKRTASLTLLQTRHGALVCRQSCWHPRLSAGRVLALLPQAHPPLWMVPRPPAALLLWFRPACLTLGWHFPVPEASMIPRAC